MSETFQATGIIVKRQDFREYDSRILVYTLEHGLLDLVARGTKRARSKLAGHIEPLNLANVMVAPGRNYDYAAAVVAAHTWPRLRAEVELSLSAQRAAAFFVRVVRPGICDRGLLKLLADLFFFLPQSGPVGPALFEAAFKMKVMAHLGYRPAVRRCALCGQESGFEFFDFSVSAPVCGRHSQPRHYHRFDDKSATMVRAFHEENYGHLHGLQINGPQTRKIGVFAEKFIDWNLN